MSALLAGGIGSPDVATLVFSLAAAILYLAAAGQPPSIRKTGIAALPVALLAILLVLDRGYVVLIGALLFAAFAEMLLAQERLNAYLAGLGALLAVRVIYAVIFGLSALPVVVLNRERWRGIAVALVAIAVVWTVRRIWRHAGMLRWPAVIYALVVMAMCAAAAALPPPWVLAGAVLLAASDIGVAFGRFLLPADRQMPVQAVRLTWLARYCGQALIAFAALRLI